MSLFAKFVVALGLAGALVSAAHADEDAAAASDRLVIVDGNSDQVIYDDGYDDLFCVTRSHFVGYNYYGHRVYRRRMRCR